MSLSLRRCNVSHFFLSILKQPRKHAQAYVLRPFSSWETRTAPILHCHANRSPLLPGNASTHHTMQTPPSPQKDRKLNQYSRDWAKKDFGGGGVWKGPPPPPQFSISFDNNGMLKGTLNMSTRSCFCPVVYHCLIVCLSDFWLVCCLQMPWLVSKIVYNSVVHVQINWII